jgi:hypothetical protein
MGREMKWKEFPFKIEWKRVKTERRTGWMEFPFKNEWNGKVVETGAKENWRKFYWGNWRE